jgi:hypothetical protein
MSTAAEKTPAMRVRFSSVNSSPGIRSMNTTKAIAEVIPSTAEYMSRSRILKSVKRGNMTSERAKPGITTSKRKPKIILNTPKITGIVSISSTHPQ